MCTLIGLAILILTPCKIFLEVFFNLKFLVSTTADNTYLKMSLNNYLQLNFLNPIESMNWLDDHRILMKTVESVVLMDILSNKYENKTILTTEQLVKTLYFIY